MSRFVAIDLANLPAPTAVVPPDYEAILAARKADVVARIAVADPALAAEVEAIFRDEYELLTKSHETAAGRELIHYQRVNEAVRAVLLPTSAGTDLDNICARLGVERQTITPATETADAVMETDGDLKYRYQLALEAFSVAGPYGAYEFHARTAHPHVKDAGVYGPESGLVEPGQALTVVLSRIGDGSPTLEVTDAVYNKLSHQDTVPDTDEVLVRGAQIHPYAIRYTLQVRPGADATLIARRARALLAAYVDHPDAYALAVADGYAFTEETWRNRQNSDGGVTPRRVGQVVSTSGLDGCAHFDRVNIVRAVRLSPTAEIDPGYDGAPWCTTITVEMEVVS